jgi:hypothetical protein
MVLSKNQKVMQKGKKQQCFILWVSDYNSNRNDLLRKFLEGSLREMSPQ